MGLVTTGRRMRLVTTRRRVRLVTTRGRMRLVMAVRRVRLLALGLGLEVVTGPFVAVMILLGAWLRLRLMDGVTPAAVGPAECALSQAALGLGVLLISGSDIASSGGSLTSSRGTVVDALLRSKTNGRASGGGSVLDGGEIEASWGWGRGNERGSAEQDVRTHGQNLIKKE